MALIGSLQAKNTSTLEGILKSTVASHWSELSLGEGLVHVEYQTGAAGELDFIKIWDSKVWGEWHLICELWMRPLWSHVAGIHFGREFHSMDFARTLELAVASADTANLLPERRGFVQVFPPTAAEQSTVEPNTGKAPAPSEACATEQPAAA
jgi:hypothetical protein